MVPDLSERSDLHCPGRYSGNITNRGHVSMRVTSPSLRVAFSPLLRARAAEAVKPVPVVGGQNTQASLRKIMKNDGMSSVCV